MLHLQCRLNRKATVLLKPDKGEDNKDAVKKRHAKTAAVPDLFRPVVKYVRPVTQMLASSALFAIRSSDWKLSPKITEKIHASCNDASSSLFLRTSVFFPTRISLMWLIRTRTAHTAPASTEHQLEMCGKAQHDSPILVLLAPPGEYDWMIRQLVPSEDFQIPVEKMVAMTVQSKFNNNTRSLPKVAISNSCSMPAMHTNCRRIMNEVNHHLDCFYMGKSLVYYC